MWAGIMILGIMILGHKFTTVTGSMNFVTPDGTLWQLLPLCVQYNRAVELPGTKDFSLIERNTYFSVLQYIDLA